MSISEENWSVLASLLPAGWQQMAAESGAVARLRGFPCPEILLRTILLHVAMGYSLRETAVHAKLAKWANVSDVALLKRLRTAEAWLRWMCTELLRENGIPQLEGTHVTSMRIVDGTIIKEPGRTGSQWRILYSLQLPRLSCDFFQVTPVGGEGHGESLNRLPVSRRDFIVADAGYCSVAGIEYVRQRNADLLVRVNPQTFVAYAAHGERVAIQACLKALSRPGQIGEWPVVLHGVDSTVAGRLCALRKEESAIQKALRRLNRRASRKQMKIKPGTLEFCKRPK